MQAMAFQIERLSLLKQLMCREAGHIGHFYTAMHPMHSPGQLDFIPRDASALDVHLQPGCHRFLSIPCFGLERHIA